MPSSCEADQQQHHPSARLSVLPAESILRSRSGSSLASTRAKCLVWPTRAFVVWHRRSCMRLRYRTSSATAWHQPRPLEVSEAAYGRDADLGRSTRSVSRVPRFFRSKLCSLGAPVQCRFRLAARCSKSGHRSRVARSVCTRSRGRRRRWIVRACRTAAGKRRPTGWGEPLWGGPVVVGGRGMRPASESLRRSDHRIGDLACLNSAPEARWRLRDALDLAPLADRHVGDAELLSELCRGLAPDNFRQLVFRQVTVHRSIGVKRHQELPCSRRCHRQLVLQLGSAASRSVAEAQSKQREQIHKHHEAISR